MLMVPSSRVMSMSLFEFELKLALDRARRHQEAVLLVLFCLQPFVRPGKGTEVGPDDGL